MKTIKKGQKFKCIKDYVMRGGQIAYKADKNYKSDSDGCLTNEQSKKHGMTLDADFYEHFEINPKTIKTEIEIPAGCKIAKTEVIDGKLIVTYERDLPESVSDIQNRDYAFVFNSTSRKRGNSIIALAQLIELAAYVGCEDTNFYFEFQSSKDELPPEFYEKYADLFEKAINIL